MNGPENISQFLRAPIADQPELGLLRLNSAEARAFELSPGQTIRGIVSDDGRGVTLFFPKEPRYYRGNFADLKGESLDFRASKSAYGVTIKPVEERMMLSTLGMARAAAAPPKPPINLQVLAAMAASPDMGDVPILSHMAGPAGFVELIRKVLPDASRTFLPQLLTTADALDANKIRLFMLANGFLAPRVGKSEFGEPRDLDIRRFLQQLLERITRIGPEAFASERAAIESVIDYLDVAKIEFMLRQEQRELALRFMMLFTDRAPVEVLIERKDQQREGKQRSVWSVEMKLSFSEEDNVWGRVELVAPRLLSVTLWLSDAEQARLATQNVSRLRGNLEEFGLDVARCQVIHGSKPEREKAPSLRSVGNLELRA